jgi:uncharacterized protein YprB with RNaseH-like and TPR domain
LNKLKNNESLCYKLIELVKDQGLSIKAACEQLFIAPRSGQEFFSQTKNWQKDWWKENKENINKSFKEISNKPRSNVRILVLDIETKFMLLEGWQLFNQNFSVDQIAEDWSILSYSAKWFDEDEIIYSDVTEKTEDDILVELYDLLDEADFVIAHNGRRFDLKKIRARMVTRGFAPYSPVRIIDTLEICKAEFAFTSNKLLYLTRLLCKKNQKSDHGKFAGHMLWKEFLKGNPEAIEEMRHYNCIDVVSLQELYEIIAPWSTKLPNFDVYEDKINTEDWEHYGYVYTNLAKYDQYRNRFTGQFRRGRTNLLTKEQRSKLLSNIV